jgi:hypothetical protein
MTQAGTNVGDACREVVELIAVAEVRDPRVAWAAGILEEGRDSGDRLGVARLDGRSGTSC